MNKLVEMYAGSIAYGTNTPESDVDIRGIFCADPVQIRTPFFPVREHVGEGEDTKYFELNHFMKLAVDCNPNIIELLWTANSDITFRTPAYDLLRQHREELLSAKIAYTTSGYAMSQLKRIKGHNKWINQPQPEDKPQQCDYVSLIQWFGDQKVLPSKFSIRLFNEGAMLVPYGSDTYGVVPMSHRSAIRPQDGSLNDNIDNIDRTQLPAPLAIIKFNREEWRLACDKWKQYWDWKKSRNVKRSALEEAHGYDTKHAMHLVRLLRMGVEAMRDGVVLVKRPDAAELLNIRNGSMTYEEVLNVALKLEAEIKMLQPTTQLRQKPNTKFAAHLLMEVQDSIWRV
jgi:predicted nucleotidyltransferase